MSDDQTTTRVLTRPGRNLLEALAIELLGSIEDGSLRNASDVARALRSSDFADQLVDLSDDELTGLEVLALALQTAAIREQTWRYPSRSEQ